MRRSLAKVLTVAAVLGAGCVLQPTDQMRFCNQAGPISSAIGTVVERVGSAQLTTGDARASVMGIREAMSEVGPLLVAIRAGGYDEATVALDALVRAADRLPDNANAQQVREALAGPLAEFGSRFNSIAAATCARR